jgi:hypothetical protein
LEHSNGVDALCREAHQEDLVFRWEVCRWQEDESQNLWADWNAQLQGEIKELSSSKLGQASVL